MENENVIKNIIKSYDCKELNDMINIINDELKFRNDNKKELTFNDVVAYMANTSEAFKGDVHLCNSFLHTLLVTNTYAFISLMMKTIAVLLDQKYPDHIRNCEKTVSNMTKTCVMIKNRRNTVTDAGNHGIHRTVFGLFQCELSVDRPPLSI